MNYEEYEKAEIALEQKAMDKMKQLLDTLEDTPTEDVFRIVNAAYSVAGELLQEKRNLIDEDPCH